MQQIDLTPKTWIASWWQKVLELYWTAHCSRNRKDLAHTLELNWLVSRLLALVPDDLEGLVVPVMDARRNNVYAGFYQEKSAGRTRRTFSI